jgi:uncharacterized protein (DUF2235 family)
LLFNFTPGDEIYVFGFSRGAFTARSFVGLIYNCGILRRRDAGEISKAIAFYRSRAENDAPMCERMLEYRRKHSLEICVDPAEDVWRQRTVPGYRAGDAQLLRIKYLGVWDTVAALGIPAHWWLSRLDRRKYLFHDAKLSKLVEMARHAVSIDERRLTFAPTVWDNVAALNNQQGADPDSPTAPYQQRWFPGDHGSVGGGGDREGLSDRALDWIVDGAREAGLNVDALPSSRIFEIVPNFRQALQNVTLPKNPTIPQRLAFWIGRFFQTADRTPGPQALHELDGSAIRRWLDHPENLPEGRYRPPTLSALEDKLDALDPADFGVGRLLSDLNNPESFDFYVVQVGDTLANISQKYYGHPDGVNEILKANLDELHEPSKLGAGMTLRLPKSKLG